MIQHINPTDFTKVIGAYSHAIKIPLGNANLIFLTGQIAMDSSGNVIAPNDIKEQTKFIFDNIKKLLEESKATMKDIVKVQVFLTNMVDFKEFSVLRNEYLKGINPVSTLLEVKSLVREGCCIEIEITAVSYGE